MHASTSRHVRPKNFLLVTVTIIAVAALVWLWQPESPRARIADFELTIIAKQHAFLLPPPDSAPNNDCKTALGRQLFFDTRLSKDKNIACATCHMPEKSFTDGKHVATALGKTNRNTPTLINAKDSFWFFWDGRADSLAAQYLGPIESDIEHGFSRSQLVGHILTDYRTDYEACFGALPRATKIPALSERSFPHPAHVSMSQAISAYTLATQDSAIDLAQILMQARQGGFAPWEFMAQELAQPYNMPAGPPQAAFAKLAPDQIDFIHRVSADVGLALQAFQETIVARDAPFDRFVQRLDRQSDPRDVEKALAADFGHQEWEGFRIFADRGQCATCHQGPTFTDQQFHNIGLARRSEHLEAGRAAGMRRALHDPFNCLGGILPRTASESCRELPYLDTDNLEMIGAFKTPTLRNLATTAPYMHDGRFADLDAVLRHYNELTDRPALGHREETLKPMQLAPHELNDLKKFLESLNSEVEWSKR